MKKILYALGCAALTLFAAGCGSSEGLTYEDITVDFAVSGSGMEGNSAEIGLRLSRPAKDALRVGIRMSSGEIPAADIEVTPAPENGLLEVEIPEGASTGSFTVARVTGKTPEGSLRFTIETVSPAAGYAVGTVRETTLSFSPFVSEGSSMQLEGKGEDENYRNMVYVDLSNNAQRGIWRRSWDLGFYCGDRFRVVLNPSYGTTAVSSGKSDFASVTLEDAMQAPSLLAGMGDDFSSLVDDTSGDLDRTVFGEISADEAENEVFFVASDDNKKSASGAEDRSLWYKVKVTATDNGYRVEYGTVAESHPRTIEVAKDPIYNLVGLSLADGQTTEAEPEARKWEFMWSYARAWSTMKTGETLSFSQDVITINRLAGVEVATVMTEEKTYADFRLADAASLRFTSDADAIGTSWRVSPMPGASAGTKKDRFYVFRDCAGNCYKLKFDAFGANDGAERGRPTLTYELLK